MYTIPTQIQKNYFSLEGFKGVDFTTSPLEVDKKRSPNAKNLINNDGYNETRNGYKVLNTIGNKINGAWNVDAIDTDLFLVHSGTCLYQCNSDFSQSALILSGMSENRSTGLYFNEYFIIFDGVRAVVYSKFDGINYEAKFLDECGYIPTTSVARNSLGDGTPYEKINLISPYRINTFVSTPIEGELDAEGNPTYTDISVFPLEEKNIDEITLVQKLDENGEWITLTNSEYTYDLEKGEVYFTPGKPPVKGRDNVSITYKKVEPKNSVKINKCMIATLYGYEGNGNRIFISGNPDLPNYDFWCDQENPLHWPDENFAKIGVEPIMGYSRATDGSLTILKRQSDTDCTRYHRTYNMFNETEVFPLTDGTKNIGCVSKYANVNLLNDALMLSDQGVFAMIGNNGEKSAMQRSYYVNGRLLKEPNLEEAIAIAVDGKYYLGVNNHIYIADSRYLSYPKHSKTEQYQYEWWYWDNIPARVFFSWNNKLYFGTEDGKICAFTEEYKDEEKNIEAYWETPFLDMGTNELAKTIKHVTLVLNPKTSSDITLGYRLDDGETNIITKNYKNLKDNFPKTIQEKEKIKKFMFIKFFMKNNTNNRMSFERLSLEYVFAGKYKGE